MRPLSFRYRNLAIAIALAAGVTLAGCGGYYGGYGGRGGYGYGGLSVGIGSGYYNNDWGYYRSNPYWGWYDGFYYPGSGYYVYDRYRRPHRWTTGHQSYWTGRQNYWRGRDDFRQSRREMRENWGDFRNRPSVRQERRTQSRRTRTN